MSWARATPTATLLLHEYTTIVKCALAKVDIPTWVSWTLRHKTQPIEGYTHRKLVAMVTTLILLQSKFGPEIYSIARVELGRDITY